jgi:hypothetical protein
MDAEAAVIMNAAAEATAAAEPPPLFEEVSIRIHYCISAYMNC